VLARPVLQAKIKLNLIKEFYSMTTHQCVSSEQSVVSEMQLHAAVSSESSELKQGENVVVPDFSGVSSKGEFESVAGFDPTRAINEGAKVETTSLPDAGENLPDAAATAYLMAETVCGADDRIRITPAISNPWRWICKLFITFPNNAQFVGTGWFIGARTVMTAGHCVYSKADGGWAKSIEVVPGMDGNSRPYGSQVGTSFRSVTGWTQDGKPEFDYGAIILPNCNLGNTVGWFGFANLSDASLNNMYVNTSGYPADKPYGTQWFNGGQITNVQERKIYYMIDTIGGQSGSPVWRFLNGERHAVGVHAYGGCPNSATRITKAVFDNMLAWRNIPC
jgi:glutamyl endopeptidase